MKNDRTAKVCVKELRLKNIGRFDSLEVPLDPKQTFLIGPNGTGKTTIIQALDLGLYVLEGYRSLSSQLLKKPGFGIAYKPGIIEIDYNIEGRDCAVIINIIGENAKGILKEPSDIASGNYFPRLPLKYMAHVEAHFVCFREWVITLHHLEGARGRSIIDRVFDILSRVSGKKTEFQGVDIEECNYYRDIWIATEDSPKGIPMRLSGKGLRALAGLIGCIAKGVVEACPDSPDFSKETAILLIDDIEAYLHPACQANLMPALRHCFTNAQFIISTHSPLIIHGADRGQVVQLTRQEGKDD
jgi:hypothetical protein